MTETLTRVSPSNSEELLEQPSLAEAAVAGAAGNEEPGATASLPNRLRPNWQSHVSWSARRAHVAWR